MSTDSKVRGWASPIGQCNVWYKLYAEENGKFLTSALVVRLGKSLTYVFDTLPSPAEVEEHFRNDNAFRALTKPME